MEAKLIESSVLNCPKGSSGHMSFDMTEIYTLEARKVEIAAVNKDKAPELMHALERGYSRCAEILPVVSYQLTVAENEVNKRKSIVSLDEAPRILQEKGLVNARNPAGSADLREAVLQADAQYIELLDRAAQIKAVQEFVRGKMRGFEMAFSSVKKVYDSLSQFGQLNNATHFSGNINDDEVSPADNISSIGNPRY